MARSAKADVLQKFRFNISVMSINLSIGSALQDIGTITGALGNALAVLTRTGFNEITLPKATVNTIHYRENIDAQRFSKGTGLVKFDPVILKRGVTSNQDLFNWYTLVNNDLLLSNAAQELSSNVTTPPGATDNFRKEVLISVNDREGQSQKQWMLFNAWPSTYKGGNDLNAQSEENLIEELTLEYEYFVEFTGGVNGLLKAILQSGAQSGISALSNFAASAAPSLPFLR